MMTSSDVVNEKFDQELKDLLALRAIIWNRYVIARYIRSTASDELWELSKKNSRSSSEADVLANNNYARIIGEMDRIAESCDKSCSIVNGMIFEVLSKRTDYSGKLNLNSLWKDGAALDGRLASKGIKSNEGDKLSDYSNRLEIEIDGLLSTTIHGSPSERAIEEIRAKVGDEAVDPFMDMTNAFIQTETTMRNGIRDQHLNGRNKALNSFYNRISKKGSDNDD